MAAGLTQGALAERAGLSERAISDLERSVKRLPRNDTLQLLARTLRLSPQERALFEAAACPIGDSADPLPHEVPSHVEGSSRALPPPVGPGRELALLERHLAHEGPPVLLLAGEPGIGKSRLLQETAQRAGERGWAVLPGGCHRRGGQEPYAPVLGAVQRHIQGRLPVHLRADLRGCAWLVRLLPELADGPIEPLPSWTVSPEQERSLMFEAVACFLANVAGPAGALLVLDDLQWAGPDALDLLATLARSAVPSPPQAWGPRAGARPLRVVGAYRDTEVGPQEPLAALLADLAHGGLALHRALAPLPRHEAERLLDGLLEGVEDSTAALRECVLQRAGGVPFFLVSCAQALQGADLAEPDEEAVPWDVAQGIRQRVAALAGTAREVLGAAAVLGRVVQPALLTAVATRPEADVLAALEAAVRARLLVEDARTYRFAHDVIREVVEADVGTARRLVLHRRVAAALEQQPGEPPVEALAYHYALSEVPDRAVLYLEQAGDRAAAQHANAAAEGYYRELVDRLEGLGRAVDAAHVREKLGMALFTVARYDAALPVYEQAADTYRAVGDVESLARTMAHIGQVHADRGTPEEGIRHIQPLLESLGRTGPSRGLAALYAALANLSDTGGRHGEQLAAAERAAELARAVQDDRILTEAEHHRGGALFAMGRREDGLRALEEAIRLAEAVGDLYSLGWALRYMANDYLERGEFDTSRRYVERALAVAERRGDPVQIIIVTCKRGMNALFAGRWTSARTDFERAAPISRELATTVATPMPLYCLGLLCLVEGAWDEASQYLAMAERSRHVPMISTAQIMLARLDLLRGHPDVACTHLVPLLDRPGLPEAQVIELLTLFAWAHLELGDVAAAEDVVRQAIERARTGSYRLALVDALWVQAMVAIRQQRWAEAKHTLEEGLALARRMPYPYAEGRLLHVYRDMHAQKGEPSLARQRLAEALAIFQRLGARKDAERAEQAIADLHEP